jgi:DNA-binding transcriptional LysR family regulator
MIRIEDLELFEALNRTGSLTAAARVLDLTPSALSMRLKRLENELKVNLVVRNARNLRFTAEGEHLVVEAKATLERLRALPEALGSEGKALAGPLKIVAPFGFGRLYIAPLIAEFSIANPGLRISLELSESPWAQNQDADVVVHIGNIRDTSWIAHRIAQNERWACASPKYLQNYGEPTDPAQLLKHRCLCLRENDEDVTLWHFRHQSNSKGRGNRREAIRVVTSLTSNDGEVIRNWAVTGLGIMLRSEWDVAPLVRKGTLKRLLSDWDFDSADVVALTPARKGISARVAQFLDFIKVKFSSKKPW